MNKVMANLNFHKTRLYGDHPKLMKPCESQETFQRIQKNSETFLEESRRIKKCLLILLDSSKCLQEESRNIESGNISCAGNLDI